MLSVSIVDANDSSTVDNSERFIDGVVSVVGNWLRWELQQSDFPVVQPGRADVVFLVFAGAVDWVQMTRKALKRAGIIQDATRRARRPYVITGGAIDVAPFTALRTADALAVGEAYIFVRQVIDLCKSPDATIEDLAQFVRDYPHAIERSQLDDFTEDPDAPWALLEAPTPIASPDEWVDWDGAPSVRQGSVVRILASKGCHLKCKFCATTYRQTYRVDPNEDRIAAQMAAATRARQNATLITNDAAALPGFARFSTIGNVSFQSLTIKALQNPDTLRALCTSGMKIARFGVEGISPRIRQAFGKPITDDRLIEIIETLQAHRVPSHMFFIVGAPYETDEDWDEFRQFNVRLARAMHYNVCRIKMTAFTPEPPTPLAYFLPSNDYYDQVNRTLSWLIQNWKSRHVLFVRPRQPKSRQPHLEELFDINRAVSQSWAALDRTVDIAPTLEHARRMKWEIVDWPLDVERRWRLSRSYAKTMGVEVAPYSYVLAG